eukprot:7011963-Lingulodinium_polyedra.AAC.1
MNQLPPPALSGGPKAEGQEPGEGEEAVKDCFGHNHRLTHIDPPQTHIDSYIQSGSQGHLPARRAH